MATASMTARPNSPAAFVSRYSDMLIAVVVCAVVAMMIIPLPEVLLDGLIIINFGLALMILLTSVFARDALQFSVFPTLLLITTLYRLGLDISATRLILLQAHAGEVVSAFGSFVVGGNFVVGVVIFLILVVVNFVVITNGAGRVAEVAARFTLDAMPGKQMAIDAELNAGAINEAQARARRRAVQQEADFYGAMDGASKFVKGDAMAAVIIMVINIAGGFIVGVVQLGMAPQDALGAYTLLTVGEGLISQLPALLISTATGIIVTRVASENENNLGKDISAQLFSNPRLLTIVGGLLCAMALVPGLPILPFIGIGGLLLGLAFTLRRRQASGETAQAGQLASGAATADGQAAPADRFEDLLKIDPISVEIGYGLVSLADATAGGSLLNRVTLIRRQLALDLGIVVPPIRIRDDLQLPPDTYVLRLRGVEVARGEVRANRFLAMNAGQADTSIDLAGIPTTEPTFGLPAIWVTADEKERAELLGYTVVDPTSVITTHLSEVLRQHSASILSRQDVQTLLDAVKAEQPAVVNELIPNPLALGDVQHVLQHLLRERVSIRDLVSILEAVGDAARTRPDPEFMGERARQALGRAICRQYLAADGKLGVMTLAPEWQRSMETALVTSDSTGTVLALDTRAGTKLLQGLAGEMNRLAATGHQPVLLTTARLRVAIRRFTERSLASLAVLAYNEVPAQIEVVTLGVVGDQNDLS